MKPHHKLALGVAGIYGLFGAAWIVANDSILASVVDDAATRTSVQAFKGWGFVLVTAILVWFLASRALARQQRLSEELTRGEARFRELFGQVQQSEERLRLALAAAKQGLYDLDVQTGDATVSPEYATMLGLDPEEFVETNACWRERLHPGDREATYRAYQEYIAGTREEYRVEFRQRTTSGAWKWILSLGKVVERDAEGQPRRMLGTHTDITERKQAEEAVHELNAELVRERALLREREAWLRAIFEAEPACVKVLAPDGELLEMNRAGLQMLEVGSVAEVGQILDFVDESSRGAFIELQQGVLAGETRTLEFQVTGRKGTSRLLETTATPLRDENEQIVAVLGVTSDITARRQLENQLRQAQKMEAVGRLAGGVAHDFNNLLTAITGCGELALHSLGDDHPARDEIQEILAAASRAGSLTRQLLAFSRKQILQPHVIDLNDVVRGTGRMLRALLGEDVPIDLDLATELGHVIADPGQMEHTLVNLAINARDAMPSGGRLTIRSSNCTIGADQAAAHPGVEPGPGVALTIADTGHGIPDEVVAHIFEPFFTTKEPSRGTGLGLASVYGIVQQSGGFISVRSKPGRGATFEIVLPRAVGAARAASGEVPEALGGDETILLVEDDAAVRSVVVRFLRRNGYRVIEADGPETALAWATEHSGAIDLLMTDVVLPGVNGRELAESMAGVQPRARVLYTSGYTADDVLRRGVSDRDVNFIQKPFRGPELARKVREVLDT